MLKNSLNSFLITFRELARQWQTVAIMGALYLLLLATLYGFIATREATAIQVLATLLFAAAAPFIFFLLQATVMGQARDGRIRWYPTLKESCKLALTALPVIAIGLALLWLTNRWQLRLSGEYTTSQMSIENATNKWTLVSFAALRTILFAVVLPLIMIHVWLETFDSDLLAAIRGGARDWLGKFRQIVVRAFSPESVLLYSIGLVLFAAVPCVLLFVHLPFQGQWSEFGVFTGRLGLAIFTSLLGWVATLSTFTRLHKFQSEQCYGLSSETY
ncbi:MAG TPA: hypothetical protein VJ124_06695 [Pyrinomonadaceae bacterium]|nr:hypothetical protein [Pyrinomonadaceae bacterium]